jgi:hypothetical protein
MRISPSTLLLLLSGLTAHFASARIDAQKCAGIAEGIECTSPGSKICCEEDMVNIISCKPKNGKNIVVYSHCTGGKICAGDGKGSVACFVPGTQPTPPD